MMYFLMNKDKCVASIEEKHGLFGSEYILKTVDGVLLYGMTSVSAWLENRKASKHNRCLRELMASCGCEKTDGYIKITHAATLNDTFWIKSENEDTNWDEVSLYRNRFNETISKLAFEGVRLYELQNSTTSPEFSTSGSFRKCWKKEGENIYLYKRGTDGAKNSGLEPYCEMMASELATTFCENAVQYQVVKLYGEHASKCKLFTDETKGFLPASLVIGSNKTDEELFVKYCEVGSEELFRRMVIVDALTFNVDRHRSNHGFLINNDSQELLEMAPIFDFNLAFLPYVTMDEFMNIGDRLLQYEPKISSDFTYTAQSMLTSEIRSDLINLKGFRFSFDGDDLFPRERVEIMGHLIERHIDAILGKERLYTIDVFPSPKLEKEKWMKSTAERLEELDFVNFVSIPNENDPNFSVDFDGSDGGFWHADFSADGELVSAIDTEGNEVFSAEFSRKLPVQEQILVNQIRAFLKKLLSEQKNSVAKEIGKSELKKE